MFVIDLENFDGGVSSATVEQIIVNNQKYIKFTNTDYIIFEYDHGVNIYDENNMFVNREYKMFNGYKYPVTIKTKFILPNNTDESAKVGIISRYNMYTFNIIEIDEFGIILKRYNGKSYVNLSNKRIYPLNTEVMHEVIIIENTNSYDIYIDGNYASTFIFNNTGDIGFYGFLGTTNVLLSEFEIKSSIPKYFNVSSNNLAVINQEGIYLKVIDEQYDGGYLYTNVSVNIGKEYCLRYTTNKQGRIVIKDGKNEISADVSNSNYITFIPNNNNIEIRLIPNQKNYFFIEKLILTDYNDPIVYIKSYDEVSFSDKSDVTIPVDIKSLFGTKFDIEMKPYSNSDKKRAIIELSDGINSMLIYYKNNRIYVMSDEEYDTNVDIKEFEMNSIFIVFENHMDMCKFTIKAGNTQNTSIIRVNINNIKELKLGCSKNETIYRANAMFKNLKIYSINDINDILLYDFDFYGAIINKMNGLRVSMIEKPKNLSPIIIESGDTVLTNTSYFDYEENQFVDYVIENVVITNSFVKVSNDNIDDTFFKPLLFIDDVYFICKSINGNIIEFDIPTDLISSLTGKIGKVKYKIKDSYSIVYNEDDTFNVIFNNYTGNNVKISYTTTEEASMPVMSVNLNPIMNHNNRGFIFISHTEPKAEYIDVKLSKDSVDLELGDYIYIIIDAYDHNGNYVPNCQFDIKTNYGQVVFTDTIDPVSYSQTTGRYIYKYTPIIDYSDYDGYIIDRITITEPNSNIIINKDIKILI